MLFSSLFDLGAADPQQEQWQCSATCDGFYRLYPDSTDSVLKAPSAKSTVLSDIVAPARPSPTPATMPVPVESCEGAYEAARKLETSSSMALREVLEEREFLKLGGRDRAGNQLVTIVPQHLPEDAEPDKVYRYLVRQLDDLVNDKYSVVLVNTSCPTENGPGIPWLCGLYERLPGRYHTNLQAVYIIHSSIGLRLAMWTVCPWLPGNLWDKTNFVESMKDLAALVDQDQAMLPDWVQAYDQELQLRKEHNQVLDYGVADASVLGLPGMYQSAVL